MCSRVTVAGASIRTSFLFVGEQFHCVDRLYFIFPLISYGRLGCFYLLAIGNGAPMNTCVPAFVRRTCVLISLRHVRRNRNWWILWESCVESFEELSDSFSKWLHHSTVPPTVLRVSVSLHLPCALYILSLGAPRWTPQRVTRTCHQSPHSDIMNATELTPFQLGMPATAEHSAWHCVCPVTAHFTW